MDPSPVDQKVGRYLFGAAFCWGLLLNVGAALLAINFYWIPKGMEIRPMGDAALVFILALAALPAIPLGLVLKIKAGRKILTVRELTASFGGDETLQLSPVRHYI